MSKPCREKRGERVDGKHLVWLLLLFAFVLCKNASDHYFLDIQGISHDHYLPSFLPYFLPSFFVLQSVLINVSLKKVSFPASPPFFCYFLRKKVPNSLIYLVKCKRTEVFTVSQMCGLLKKVSTVSQKKGIRSSLTF